MKISIITVCFNSEATIAECLKSVASQSWSNFEHIIVDGASTDGTLMEIEAYSHKKLKLTSEPDNGMYDAMNKGLKIATGDYVAFLNSDDLYANDDVIKWVAETAANTSADCILGNVQFFTADRKNSIGRYYSSNGFARWWIKVGIMPPHPGFFAKRSLMLRAGGFDESYKIAADFDLVARLVIKHEASWITLRKTVALFRMGGITTANRSVRSVISAESARSLSGLAISFSRFRVLLRFPIKALQYFSAG